MEVHAKGQSHTLHAAGTADSPGKGFDVGMAEPVGKLMLLGCSHVLGWEMKAELLLSFH